jgi:hypothetical protein
MAINPMQARSSVQRQLTDEEKQEAAALESKLDAKLAQLFGAQPESHGLSFTLEDTPGDSVKPWVLAEVVRRYEAVGWSVIIHQSNPNLQLQFNW